MKFSERVYYLRKKNGYTQGELAEKIGITQPAIQALETGRAKQPKGTTVIKLAAVLGVSAEELLREE